ncbi:hypothetical protein PENPOL_c001G03260 [Penicillium polonicum]|uniref:Uncharacterized protein n=1 Tax=Penicillium polonicum TaxID=60169 RepID=A0A1V6P2T7_PENPO|nr:hypothetical protein PENPOL_c001G03260 [Penicillium polonicum]
MSPRSQQQSSSWYFLSLPQLLTFGNSTEQRPGSVLHFRLEASWNIADWLPRKVEVIGYVGRAAANNSTDSVIIFAIQNVILLLGPTLFAASVYMTLGRIIRSVHAEQHSLVPMNWLTKISVMGDVVSFLVQGGASGLTVTGNNVKMASNIVVAGLVIQVVMFGLFIGLPDSGKTLWLDKLETALGTDDFAFYDGSDIIAAVTPGGLEASQNLGEEAKNHCRELAIARIKQECCNTGKSAIVAGHSMVWPEEGQAIWLCSRRSPTTEAFDERINWMSRVRTLYAVSALILIRSIFRVVEYAAGDDGYPLTHEWMLYVFDSVLMIISMLVWGIWHPGTTPRITVPDQEIVTEVAVGLELKEDQGV